MSAWSPGSEVPSANWQIASRQSNREICKSPINNRKSAIPNDPMNRWLDNPLPPFPHRHLTQSRLASMQKMERGRNMKRWLTAVVCGLISIGFLAGPAAKAQQAPAAVKSFDLIDWNGGKFIYGADYYPEAWPESQWEKDAIMMQEAGINFVRMGEFAWVKMEPQEGHFDFAWLDRALKILYAHGIKAVLGTPTASPPAWLCAKY